MDEVQPPALPPILYILVRTDITSMNAGKVAAQACHAQRHADRILLAPSQMDEMSCDRPIHPDTSVAYQNWCDETPHGFGTTHVLAAPDGASLDSMVTEALAAGLPGGVIHDPTYPVRDGQVTHLVPLNTVAWVFAPRPEFLPASIAALPFYP